MMDPDFFEDDGYDEGFDDGEEYVFDTYDSIIDENAFDEVDPDRDENCYDWDITGAEMGLMGALASEFAEEKGHYALDENMDRKNWEQAVKVSPYAPRRRTASNLPPFEQYVQDYIQRGCRHLDD